MMDSNRGLEDSLIGKIRNAIIKGVNQTKIPKPMALFQCVIRNTPSVF